MPFSLERRAEIEGGSILGWEEIDMNEVAGGFPVVPVVGGLVVLAVIALIVWAVRARASR
jgi:hypothetical protein